jgi:hypothetical protein
MTIDTMSRAFTFIRHTPSSSSFVSLLLLRQPPLTGLHAPLPMLDRLCLIPPDHIVGFLSAHQSLAAIYVSPHRAAPQLSSRLLKTITVSSPQDNYRLVSSRQLPSRLLKSRRHFRLTPSTAPSLLLSSHQIALPLSFHRTKRRHAIQNAATPFVPMNPNVKPNVSSASLSPKTHA